MVRSGSFAGFHEWPLWDSKTFLYRFLSRPVKLAFLLRSFICSRDSVDGLMPLINVKCDELTENAINQPNMISVQRKSGDLSERRAWGDYMAQASFQQSQESKHSFQQAKQAQQAQQFSDPASSRASRAASQQPM